MFSGSIEGSGSSKVNGCLVRSGLFAANARTKQFKQKSRHRGRHVYEFLEASTTNLRFCGGPFHLSEGARGPTIKLGGTSNWVPIDA